MTRHSTPFSSAMILADLTSSLETDCTPFIKTQAAGSVDCVSSLAFIRLSPNNDNIKHLKNNWSFAFANNGAQMPFGALAFELGFSVGLVVEKILLQLEE